MFNRPSQSPSNIHVLAQFSEIHSQVSKIPVRVLAPSDVQVHAPRHNHERISAFSAGDLISESFFSSCYKSRTCVHSARSYSLSAPTRAHHRNNACSVHVHVVPVRNRHYPHTIPFYVAVPRIASSPTERIWIPPSVIAPSVDITVLHRPLLSHLSSSSFFGSGLI